MSRIELPGRFWRIADTPAGPRGTDFEELRFDTSDTVLLIVDVYGAGFDDGPVPDGLRGTIYEPDEATTRIVRRVPTIKQAARAAGIATIYLTNALRPGMTEGNVWREMSLRNTGVDVLTEWQAPTPVLEFSKIVAPDEDDVLIEKNHYSGFFETVLDSALRNRGIKNLVMLGFDSRVCLGATATDALFRNYRVVVLRDATLTLEFPETKEGGWANFMAIRYIESQVGHTCTADEFIAACNA